MEAGGHPASKQQQQSRAGSRDVARRAHQSQTEPEEPLTHHADGFRMASVYWAMGEFLVQYRFVYPYRRKKEKERKKKGQ